MRKARAYHEPSTDASSCDCEQDARNRDASHAIFQDENLTADFAEFAEIMRRLKVGDIGAGMESALVRAGIQKSIEIHEVISSSGSIPSPRRTES